MNTWILNIGILICLVQINQANRSTSILKNDTLLKVKGTLSKTYYIAGGRRDPQLSQLSKYIVSIRTRNPLRYFGDNHFCGGVVISSTAILTSGHCVMDKRKILTRGRRMLVVGGTFNRLEPSRTTVQYPVKSIVANSDYVRSNINDMAVIYLKREITADNENIKIMKMPTGPPNYKANCTVLGWGRMMARGPLPALLLRANVRVQDPEECRTFLREYYYDGLLCVIGIGAAIEDGPCLGDTGGPLICNGELRGIVSFVTGCLWRDSPSLFTDVWHHRKWIEEHLNSAASFSHKTHRKIYVILILFIINFAINSQ